MTALLIVRHGNTFEAGEKPRRVGARTDLPLTEKGREQAAALGRQFAAQGMSFARLLSSPLLRTRQTADLILAEQAAPPIVEPVTFLAEIDHGPDENQPEDTVLARIGQPALDAWDASAIAPPGWTVDAEARIAAWRDLFAAERGSPAGRLILLTTSNGAARFALIAAGLSGPLKLRTGAYGRIEIGADGTIALREWDRRPGDPAASET